MRVPRIRPSIRLLMILVAMAALFLGGAHLRHLKGVYRQRAVRHAQLEVSSRRIAKYAGALARIGAERPGAASSTSRRADYHAAMRQKYEDAAAHPWLSVDPDPPAP